MRFSIVAAVLCVVSFAGCGTLPHIPPQPAPASEYLEPWVPFEQAVMDAGMRSGHAIVRGQAFSKTVGGDVKYGAGNTIFVFPASKYTAQCMSILDMSKSHCAERLKPYMRSVIADAEGRFEVDGLAPGSYLFTTTITWGVPGPYGITTTGGPVTATVEVKSDTDVIKMNLD